MQGDKNRIIFFEQTTLGATLNEPHCSLNRFDQINSESSTVSLPTEITDDVAQTQTFMILLVSCIT